MSRTSPLPLAVAAVLGGIAGFVLDLVLTNAARPTFAPSSLLPVMLLLLSGGVIAVAWPVRRSVREGTRIDPFRAVRVATLARAASLLGAILTGFGGGLALFLLSRPVAPQVGSMVVIVFLIVSAIVLVVAGLIAESFCTLPKDPDERQRDDPAGRPDPAY